MQSDRDIKTRLTSIDTYRGMVMFLMLAEMLELGQFAEYPFRSGLGKWLQDQGVFEFLRFHTSHVSWFGCSLHDMIQPSFSFLVGVSLPFSLQSRKDKGESFAMSTLHAFWRGLLLASLGIFLRSLRADYHQTNFTFDDTLTQIGFGYFLLFLIANGPKWLSLASIATILIGYWFAFVLYKGPADFDYAKVIGPNDFSDLREGFLSHWNKNNNLASAVDVWFMNLFPRPSAFTHSGGGYCTLSFIPTLATMLLGLLAGRWLKEIPEFGKRAKIFLIASTVCLTSAYVIDALGICPIVKRIWTPSWVLWSGGICFGALLFLHAICDRLQWSNWAFFWIVIGSNSIAAYVMDWTMQSWVKENLIKHLGKKIFGLDGEPPLHFWHGLATLAVFWFILLWMYRRKVFVKV